MRDDESFKVSLPFLDQSKDGKYQFLGINSVPKNKKIW
jgi:hypothetical protein